MRDVWLEYISKEDLKSVSETEKEFADFIVLLRKAGVCPTMFTMRGDWGNGISQYYTHDYHFVDFGIEQIIMKVDLF